MLELRTGDYKYISALKAMVADHEVIDDQDEENAPFSKVEEAKNQDGLEDPGFHCTVVQRCAFAVGGKCCVTVPGYVSSYSLDNVVLTIVSQL